MQSSIHSEITVDYLLAPSKPLGFSEFIGDRGRSELGFEWEPVTDDGGDAKIHYSVYRVSDGSDDAIIIKSNSSTTYDHDHTANSNTKHKNEKIFSSLELIFAIMPIKKCIFIQI